MVTFPNRDADEWTTRALTEFLWKDEVPKFSLLWMSDPDFSQHNTAPGAPIALGALKSVDDNLAAVLAALEAKAYATRPMSSSCPTTGYRLSPRPTTWSSN